MTRFEHSTTFETTSFASGVRRRWELRWNSDRFEHCGQTWATWDADNVPERATNDHGEPEYVILGRSLAQCGTCGKLHAPPADYRPLR